MIFLIIDWPNFMQFISCKGKFYLPLY